MLVPHNKPKGGRNKAAKFPTMMWRIPIGLKPAIEDLAALYRSENWDGHLANLNYGLITGIEITNVSATVLNLVNYIKKQPNWLEEVAPNIKSDFVREVGSVLGDKPDSGNDIVVSLQDELRQKDLEIAQLKQQLSNSNKQFKVVIDESGIDKLRSVVGDKESEVNQLKTDNSRLVELNKQLDSTVSNLENDLGTLKRKHTEFQKNYAALKADKYWLDKMYSILKQSLELQSQRGATIQRSIEFAMKIAPGYHTQQSVDRGFEILKQSFLVKNDRSRVRKLNDKAFSVLMVDPKKYRAFKNAANIPDVNGTTDTTTSIT
ncbi:MAG: hypothetical protein KME64_00890 [Scytonematopsis contorta HA4267-MV1]|jgi:chaperonin cofactor prefoldin|nr:hypothetical protein [Scytonematopsis contorta HA4267-MV1]